MVVPDYIATTPGLDPSSLLPAVLSYQQHQHHIPERLAHSKGTHPSLPHMQLLAQKQAYSPAHGTHGTHSSSHSALPHLSSADAVEGRIVPPEGHRQHEPQPQAPAAEEAGQAEDEDLTVSLADTLLGAHTLLPFTGESRPSQAVSLVGPHRVNSRVGSELPVDPLQGLDWAEDAQSRVPSSRVSPTPFTPALQLANSWVRLLEAVLARILLAAAVLVALLVLAMRSGVKVPMPAFVGSLLGSLLGIDVSTATGTLRLDSGKIGDRDPGDDLFAGVDRPPAVPVEERPPLTTIVTTADGQQRQTVGSLVVALSSVLGYGSHGTVVFRGSLNGRPVAVKRMLSQFHRAAERWAVDRVACLFVCFFVCFIHYFVVLNSFRMGLLSSTSVAFVHSFTIRYITM